MSENLQALEELQTRAQEELAAAGTVEATEAWFRDYLGRTGALTNFLRGLSDLPRAERPAAGRAGNQLKNLLEEALHTRQDAIRRQEMEETLAAEGVDVTMPGRRPALGKIHPSNQTLREIATATGCGYSTVRTHLKHIFAKLGVSRQFEVAQTVLALSSLPRTDSTSRGCAGT